MIGNPGLKRVLMMRGFFVMVSHPLARVMLLFFAITSCHDKTADVPGPVKPEDALSTFQLAPGFEIELIASEPLVADPVDMEIDEYGRLYIVEMHGYPLDKSGSGQVKLLTDSDGDGRLDKSTLFADSLTMPFGIMRWKKGLLVADAPDILYFEDSTGDGRADIRKVILTGFAFSNAQMNAGNPLYGLDNWIYLTSESGGTYQIYKEQFGDLGSDIHYPGVKDSPVLSLEGSGRTVRFRPDELALELTSGETQFGHSFDRWGRHVLGDNSNHIYHEVVAAQYLKRNPDLIASSAVETLTDHGSNVYSITRKPRHQLLTSVGVFTSACGNTLYGGGAFPEPYNDRVGFVAEPVSNIVHADLLSDDGASFKASRLPGQEEKEYLASTDPWFRPVNMYVGPDGSLYVLDYYRQVIEHPEWMSEEAIKAGDLYNGRDMGRIYRISATGAKPARWMNALNLGEYSDEELIEHLSNTNSWWRMNAQRLLVDRRNNAVVPALEDFAKNSPSASGRLHALWTLEGLGRLKPELIGNALKDSVAGIRENAVKLLEAHLDDFPHLAEALLNLESDPDPKVRFQVLCTVGFLENTAAAAVRNSILFKDIDDTWVQIAALSARGAHSSDLLELLLKNYDPANVAYASMVTRLTSMAGASGSGEAMRNLLRQALTRRLEKDYSWQAAILEGLGEGLERRQPGMKDLASQESILLDAVFEHPSGPIRRAVLEILRSSGIHNKDLYEQASAKAIAIAGDATLSEERRTEAIHFLGVKDPTPYASFLKDHIIPQEPASIQLAALQTLNLVPGRAVSDYALENWATLTPQIRTAAINTFLSSEERVVSLLDAIDSGRIQKASVSFYQGVRLMTQRNPDLRTRARNMFSQNEEEQVIAEYKEALTMKGDAVKGEEVYKINCSMCHQMGGKVGVPYGPDLGTIKGWNPKGILANIVSPNLSIAAGYELWDVEMNDGQSLQGIISSETPTAISIRNAGMPEKTINRLDIKSLTTLNISGMPSGLEKNISAQQMADLIAFLTK